MILVSDAKGNKTEINPEKIDIMLASHKYVEIYTEGKMHLHDESIRTLYAKYGKDFLVIRRGLIIQKDFIKTLPSNKGLERFVVPIRNEVRYPKDLYISRRNVQPLVIKLRELGKLSS